jgi:DNA replication initiation complex subunit (GINS family)
MSDVALTYEQLFDTLRREKSRDELQKLDKGFYDAVRTFLAIKQDMIRQEQAQSSFASQRASIEYQNVKRIIKELYDRRERKIVTLAMHRTRTDAAIIDNEALMPEEKLFLESLVQLMLLTREQVLSSVEMREPIVVTPTRYAGAYTEAQTVDKPADDNAAYPDAQDQRGTVETAAGDTYSGEECQIKVRFIAPVPKFMGKDLRVFGPYEEGAQAELPDDIAEILIKKGRAQELDP